MPFEITKEETDQTPNRKLTPTMVGTAEQIANNLSRYKEAGMTMPMLWPPFSGTPTSKTIDDLRQLKEDILPQIV
jgi:FMNH2-dependent dimethyl sulfone monooxygenase